MKPSRHYKVSRVSTARELKKSLTAKGRRSGLPATSFNALDRIDPAGIDAAEDAALLAEAPVTDPLYQVAKAHRNEGAKAVLTPTVDRFDQLLATMQDSDARTG